MSFEIVVGSDKEAFESEQAARESLMRLGVAGRTIYLNGGSDTRRSVREFWAEYARARNIQFRNYGNCVLVVGGRP
jgi:hypothetical protein